MDSLSDPSRRRAGLVFLADRSGTEICEDVAMVADDSLLESLADQIAPRAAPRSRRGFAWLFVDPGPLRHRSDAALARQGPVAR